MEDFWTRFTGHLMDRVTGPMRFRLLMQPFMAAMFAIQAGRHDARMGRPPYLWSLLAAAATRGQKIREAWKDVGKIFLLAVVLDVIYQLAEVNMVYPEETLVVAFLLAIVPYVFLRGLVTRFARRR